MRTIPRLSFFVTASPLDLECVRERFYKGELGKEDLLRMLKEVDPESARQIPHGNAIRLMRALEVYYGTGKTRSEIIERRVEGRAGSL